MKDDTEISDEWLLQNEAAGMAWIRTREVQGEVCSELASLATQLKLINAQAKAARRKAELFLLFLCAVVVFLLVSIVMSDDEIDRQRFLPPEIASPPNHHWPLIPSTPGAGGSGTGGFKLPRHHKP